MNKANLALLNSFLLLGLSLNASAASATWNSSTGTTWNASPSNWSAAFPNGASDVATFDASGTLPAGSISLGQAITVSGIVLKDGALTSGTGNVTISDATNALTIAGQFPLSALSGQSLNLDVNTAFTYSSSSVYYLNGTSTTSTSGTITFGSGSDSRTLTLGAKGLQIQGGTVTINSGVTLAVVSTSAIGINSGATLNLNSTSFSGTFPSTFMTVNSGGTLNIGSGGSYNSARTAIAAGGALYLTKTNTVLGGTAWANMTTPGTGSASSNVDILGLNAATNATGTVTTVNINYNSLVGNGTFQFYAAATNTLSLLGVSTGVGQTGTLLIQKTGAGTVILKNANNFVGTTSVQSGTLQLSNNQALQNSVLDVSGSGTVTLSGVTNLGLGGLTGSRSLTSVVTTGYSSVTGITLNTQTGASNTYSGVIANGATAGTSLTVTGTGTQTLSGASSFSGGTSVSGTATLILGNGSGTALTTAANNTNGSATGTGALTVGANATLGGAGTSAGTSFSVTGTSGNNALILVGQTFAGDTNTTGALTLLGGTASGNSSIANANLAFNLDATSVGAGNKLNVGATGVDFSAGNVTLTLNIQNVGIIPANSAYVLIAGTGTTGMTGSSTPTATTGQFTGLETFVNAQGLNEILNSGNGQGGNLALALSGLSATYYANGSYLFINNASGVDDIEVEVVPEPGTWALMLGGLVMLLWIQRKRSVRSMQS
jgi:fibronectin-binding autotransporter adhesin